MVIDSPRRADNSTTGRWDFTLFASILHP